MTDVFMICFRSLWRYWGWLWEGPNILLLIASLNTDRYVYTYTCDTHPPNKLPNNLSNNLSNNPYMSAIGHFSAPFYV